MPTSAISKNSDRSPHNEAISIQLTTTQDDWRPVFIAGNFNNWKVGEERFKMTRKETGIYTFRFPDNIVLPEAPTYRYYKGGIENAELDAAGQLAPARKMEIGQRNISDTVPGWSSYGLLFNPAHRPIVSTLVESFDIPQLGRTRCIWSVLPHDYYQSEKHYPVLYLHDAQNLLGDGAGFGSWKIEEKLAKLAITGKHELIIIAIEHGEKDRINEFLPFATQKFGHGNGREYVRFLSETLKPYVDVHLRTLPGRAHTGVGGSSMAGLISIYAGLMAPDTFGRFMIFSPSLWIAQHAPLNTIHFVNADTTRIYLYGGGKEGSNMVGNVESFRKSLEQKGLDNDKIAIQMSIDPDGQHRESRWGEEFPKAVEWLFFR